MRPRQLVVIAGTGTEVGKTWVAVELIGSLIELGNRVSVRKPAQSYAAGDTVTDADLLGHASGEPPLEVCPQHRWYAVPMAPPMAAAALGRPVPQLAELAGETACGWPNGPVDVGVVETAGGVASPQAGDGDTVDLCGALEADLVVLVGDAGLGTINAVRLAAQALAPRPVVVHLNRFDTKSDLHRANRDWLAQHDGFTVTTDIADLVERVTCDRTPGT